MLFLNRKVEDIMTKKFKNEIKKLPKRFMAFTMIFAMLFSYFAPITKVFATSSTTTLSVSFRGDNANYGIVQYSLDDGASWIDVTEDISNLNISVTGDNLRIRIVPNNNYSVDYSGIGLRLDETDYSGLSEYGLETTTGYSVPSNIQSVRLEQVEFREGEGENFGGGSNFDGRAVVLWSCGNGVCYHEFDDIPDFDDGNSTFYKDTEIVADNKAGTTFDVDAQYIGWYLTDEFTAWQELYEIATGHEVNWNTLDPELVIGEPNQHIRELETAAINAGKCSAPSSESCINLYAANQGQIWTHKLQPLGEPEDNNAYVSYGDRNFKVVIYNDDFKGITMGDLSELSYYPEYYTNPLVRQDHFDISGTTKNRPTFLNSILLESTVIIRALNYNSFVISSIEALDVPEDAVTITKESNGDFKLVFSSNFYDNVVFKVTDTKSEVSYLQVKRFTIDGWVANNDEGSTLIADFYFDREKSYSDFDLTAKVILNDGTTKNVILTAKNGIDDGLGNITDGYEVDEQSSGGKGLKKSTFVSKLEGIQERDIDKIYLNAEYKGSTASNYAGAYVGSGEGTLANLYKEEGE